MEDVRAVLDACESRRVTLFGLSEGGPMSLLFAATYPERTTGLVLFGSFAKLVPAADYLPELREQSRERLLVFVDAIENHWGEGQALSLFMPSLGSDANARRMLGMFERAAASPAMVRALQQFNLEVDVRHVLPVVSAPTLVLHRTGDLVSVEYGRYVADHVPDASFVELAGEDHVPWLGDSVAVLDEVEQLLTGARHAVEHDRALTTVLFTDIPGSTERAAQLGDDRWRVLLETHNELVRRQLAAFGGREVKLLGDGFLATFDGPVRAIRCACEIRDAIDTLGLAVRAGVHTGMCELIGADIGGMAVHICARVVALAAPGEVLLSSAVRDLVVGSGIESETAAPTSSRACRESGNYSPWPRRAPATSRLGAERKRPIHSPQTRRWSRGVTVPPCGSPAARPESRGLFRARWRIRRRHSADARRKLCPLAPAFAPSECEHSHIG